MPFLDWLANLYPPLAGRSPDKSGRGMHALLQFMTVQNTNKILAITFFLYLTIFLATRLGVLIHEILGHGLGAVLMGGHLTSISVHLFATGLSSYELPDPGLPHRVIAGLGGIAVNLLSGIAALIVLERTKFRWENRIILCIFAMVSIGSQLAYLVMGTYYGHGDPSVFEELLGPMTWLVWVLFLIVIAPATYFLARSYLTLQEELFPSDSMTARAGVLFTTFIAASLIYAACFFAEDRTTGFLGGMATTERMITLHAEKAVEGQSLTEGERIQRIEDIKNELRPFPIIVPIFLVGLFSGLLAFLKTRNRPSPPVRHHFHIGYLWRGTFVSLLVGGLIVWL